MIEIKKTASEKFEFFVKSETGKVLLKSVPFTDEKSVSRTVDILTKMVSPMKSFERRTNFSGQFLFELKNKDGKIIGSSGLYSSEAGMENGIKNLNAQLKSQSITHKIQS
jgi:uncharacterized protein YegP (UPF0339 family)